MNFTPLQRRVLMLFAVLGVGLPVGTTLLKESVFDAKDLYVYAGGSGPYAVVHPPYDGEGGTLGAPKTQFYPGEWLGFRSRLTVEDGVGLIGTRIIVRMSDQREVRTEEVRLPPGTRREGDKEFFLQLPVDLRAGAYQLRIKALFFPKGRSPVAAGFENFKVYEFEVIAP